MALPLSYNLRNLFVRKTSTILTVMGVALVITVFAALMAFAEGVRTALSISGTENNVVVLKQGATAESNSAISIRDANRLTSLQLLASDEQDRPLISPEVVVMASVTRIDGSSTSNVAVRGVGPMAFKVHQDVSLVRGKMFSPGALEVIVGKSILRRFKNVDIGDKVQLGLSNNRHFTVVGIFEADGGALESEIWGYRSVIMDIYRRTQYSSVIVRLSSPYHVDEVVKKIKSPSIGLAGMSERDYYRSQGGSAEIVRRLAGILVVIMGIGAAFAVANAMFAAVAGRTREIATLRAIGFGRSSIMICFILESVLLSLIGGAIGCAISLMFNGRTLDVLADNTFTMLAFEMTVTPQILVRSMIIALVVGLVGSFQPARRAANLELIEALRDE